MAPCLADADCRRGSHGSGGFGLRRMRTFQLGLRSLARLSDRRE